MSKSEAGRVVAGVVDGEDGYFSRAVAAGGYVFVSGTPVDDEGRFAEAARPGEPYELSPAAQVSAQTRYVLEMYHELLPQLGSSLVDVLQLEQYVRLKVQSDGYFRIALSAEFLGRGYPVGATAQVGGFFPDEAAFGITGLGIVPDEPAGFVKTYPGDPGDGTTAGRRFSQVTAAGPYAFTTIFPSDGKTGVPAEARLPDWIWSGSEIRSETEWMMAKLETTLSLVGATIADVVDYTLFLPDVADLYEFDLAWSGASDAPPPSRTVMPAKGFALPRREGTYGHEQGAPRMEIQLRSLIPGKGAEKVVVDGPGHGVGHQSAGVRGGPLLWISSQSADPDQRGSVAAEVENTMDKLATICANGGTTLGSLLRLRALVTEPEHARVVYKALRRLVPADPPCVSIVVVSSPLAAKGASVAMDGVAFVES